MRELTKQISSWILGYSPLFLLSLLCLLLYLPALQHDFVADDRVLIVENPYIKSWKYWPQILSKDLWNISDPTNYWRPVLSTSFALDYSLWGLNPLGFHLINILFHALNTVLLYLIAKRLLNATGAVFASLLFALHPIQAQAVNLTSSRGDLLAAFFTLLSIQAFLSRKLIPFAITLMLALLSKETSMVLPLAFLSAWFIIQRDRKDLRLILAFAILVIYLLVRISLGFSFSLIPLVFSYHASTANRLLLVFKVLALYFRALFNLFEMPHPFWTVEIPASLNDPYVISGILISGLLIAAIWRNLRKNPILAFGLMWFVIYFLPISNLKQLNQPMAEHWLYIPMIGLSLAFGTAMDALSLFRFSGARMVRLGVVTSVIVFLFFAGLVVREKTKIYQDGESFWLAAIRANPQVARLYSILGSTYLVKQDIPRAKEFYIKTLTLDPNDFTANYMLGFLVHQAGQPSEAKRYLERVTQINPVLIWDFLTVAHAWEMLGDKQKALSYYRKALELSPDSAQTRQKVATLENTLAPPSR